MDGIQQALKLDKTYQTTITIYYNIKRKVSKTFTISLGKEEITKFPKLSWIHLHKH